ncbi:MAG TPA: glucose 1-dehydrogenase [Alphaproteobacteria bacterium]|nr:glucose 1-dehydrogenase [Alphaproteobacteria bacterium]
MDKRLNGKIAIITGSGRGIGRACALRYGAEGATVIVNDINAANVEKVVAEINAAGGKAVAHACDVTDPDAVQAMVDRAVKEFGRLDVLYANAGGSMPKPTHLTSNAEYRQIIALNQDAVFYGIHAALPVFMKQKSGLFLTTASGAGQAGVADLAAYGAAKAAVINLMRVIAVEYGGMGIRANSISPGPMGTANMRGWLNTLEGGADAFEAQVPSGRLGTEEDIAVAAAFLATDEAFFINGVCLPVDGAVSALLASPRPGKTL